MLEQLLHLDSQITSFLANLIPHTTVTDYFFSFFSQHGSSIAIWIALVLFIIIIEEKKDKRFILYFFIAFILATGLTFGIKQIVKRQRPFVETITNIDPKRAAVNEIEKEPLDQNIKEAPVVDIKCPRDFSFPSGHSSAAFASATILAYFDKKRKYIYYLVALLIAFSRIYLGCHYLIDVLGGSSLGVLLAQAIIHSTVFFKRRK